MAQSERLLNDAQRANYGESPKAVLPLEHRALTLGGLQVQATVYLAPSILLTDDGGGLFYEPRTKVGRDLLEPPKPGKNGHNFVAVTLLANEQYTEEAVVADVRHARPGAIPEITGKLEQMDNGTYSNPDHLESGVFWCRILGIVYGGQEPGTAQFNGSIDWRDAALKQSAYIDDVISGRITEANSLDGVKAEAEQARGINSRLMLVWNRLWYTS